MKTYQVAWRVFKGLCVALKDEYRRGTLGETISLTRKNKRPTFANDLSYAELLEEKVARNGDKPFLHFQGKTFSYRQMDENANRIANYLLTFGCERGQSLAIIMKNSSRWLDVFFGTQRLGMCAVPVNISLRGAQLEHIVSHSEAKVVVVDHDLLPFYEKIKDDLSSRPEVIVNLEGAPQNFQMPGGYTSLEDAYGPVSTTHRPEITPWENDLCLLMYTSGTTGLPKGVAMRYGQTMIKMMGIMSRVLISSKDMYYTAFPLFHGNALMLTVVMALHANAQVALSVKFSASKFWDEVIESRATIFNGLGAMIPILMKQPERPEDRKHKVKYVFSAACPADMWEPFEKRFGVEIIEGYGAVDGGGLAIMNYGQAPVGSLGKPMGAKVRVVDENMNDVPVGEPGELVSFVGEKESSPVEYYKNEKASTDRVTDGWLHSGDLVYADEKGYLYFVGRKTESMRRRGENISAYEVEHAILQHPDILEAAVYAVPSELAEDDVMAAIVPLEGKTVAPKDLAAFLKDHLAKFAIPRYYRILPELPKTETQRVIKRDLEKEGVTPDTVDLEG